jgi:hypothetical protein
MTSRGTERLTLADEIENRYAYLEPLEFGTEISPSTYAVMVINAHKRDMIAAALRAHAAQAENPSYGNQDCVAPGPSDVFKKLEYCLTKDSLTNDERIASALQVIRHQAPPSGPSDAIYQPHPRWKPNDGYRRHPQTVEEWDHRTDPIGGALERSILRLNVAIDYDDPREPDGMALVSRNDLIHLKHDWVHKNAVFEIWLKERQEKAIASSNQLANEPDGGVKESPASIVGLHQQAQSMPDGDALIAGLRKVEEK